MIYVGIDPGKSGAMAMIGEDGITVLPFSETTYLAHLRALSQPSRENARVCLEHVSAMPGQGVTSMFNFGKGSVPLMLSGSHTSLYVPRSGRKNFPSQPIKTPPLPCAGGSFPMCLFSALTAAAKTMTAWRRRC